MALKGKARELAVLGLITGGRSLEV